MTLEQMYFNIGGMVWITMSVLTIIALGRYAFHCALHENPCPSKCKLIWGIPLIGEYNAGWLETCFFSVLIYIILGFFAIIVWPVGIFVIIHLIIQNSRKKRFGK